MVVFWILFAIIVYGLSVVGCYYLEYLEWKDRKVSPAPLLWVVPFINTLGCIIMLTARASRLGPCTVEYWIDKWAVNKIKNKE